MTAPLRGEPSEERLIPPFTEMFFARQGGTCAASELMTPGNTAQLWAAANQRASVLDVQLIDVQSRIPLSHSEWGRLPWLVTDAPDDWFGEFIDAVINLGDDAAAGRCPIPRCAAEEMALHLMLEDITSSPDPGVSDLTATACTGLPILDWDDNWQGHRRRAVPEPAHPVPDRVGFEDISGDYELVAETAIVWLAVNRWLNPYDECDPQRPASMCGSRVLS
jgi:hypothetical protein